MDIISIIRFLTVPRVIIAKLPYLATAICLVLLGVHYLNGGAPAYKYVASWLLAVVSLHASIRPSWLGFGVVSGIYLLFAGMFMNQLVSDYQSGQPYIAGAVIQLVIIGMLLCIIGWYFWRCRPKEEMDGDFKQAPIMGYRCLPEKKKKD